MSRFCSRQLSALVVTGLLAVPGIAAATPVIFQQEPDRQQTDDPLRFARSLYNDGLYDLAIDQLQRRLTEGLPPSIAEDARWLLAQTYVAAERIADAAAAYLDFTSRHGSSLQAPRAYLLAGDLFSQAGDPASAARAYSGFLGLYPNNDQRPRATAGLAAALLADDRAQEAMTRVVEAQRTFAFHPLQPRFLLLEAQAHRALGARDEASVRAADALDSATDPEVRAEAAALQAQLLVEADRHDEAIEAARIAIDAPAPEERVPLLRGVLGQALTEAGRPGEALAELRVAVAGTEGAERAEAAAWFARAHIGVGHPDSALAAFEIAHSLLRGERRATIALEMADVSIARGDWSRALRDADRAAQDAATPGIRLRAVEAESRAQVALGRPTTAVARYRTLLADPDLPTGLRARALMELGRIYGDALSDWTAAAGSFRQAAVAAGSGELWARALWSSAEALAAQSEYASAVTELMPVANAGGALSQESADRIAYWRAYRVVDLQSGLRSIQQALLAIASGGDEGRGEALLQIARANAGALKDFETAVSSFDEYLTIVSDGPEAAQAYLEKGEALEALAVIARTEQDPRRERPWQERASEAYRAAVRIGGQSSAAEQAQLALIELELLALADQPVLYYQAMRDRYQAFLEQFTATSRLNEVMQRLGEANEGLGFHADPFYYGEAASVYRLMLEGNRPPAVLARARLGLGRSLYRGDLFTEAADVLEAVLIDLPPDTPRDEVLFMAGDSRLQSQDPEGAVAHFQELEIRYPESSWTARASEATGDLLMDQGRPAEAVSPYQRFLDGAGAGAAGRARFKLAMALARSSDTESVLDLARMAAADSLVERDVRIRALELWGNTAADRGETAQALAAWGALWTEAPDSSFTMAIAPRYGLMLSDSGDLGRAEGVWQAIAARTTADSLKIRAEAELVFLAFAGNRIDVGNQRREAFERTHRRNREVLDTYRPLFWTIEGQVRLAREEWEQAGAAFEEIMDQAEDSQYAPGALYGLGVVAVKQEDVEGGRERFEELLARFPEAVEADRARYDLGQLAYLTAEYQTAVPLFRAVANCGDRALEELGQFYLVETLHRMQAWDSAQQEALTYLERFPDATDRFDMQVRLGRLYREGGQPGRARDYFRNLRASSEEDQARLRFQLAETLFVLGEYEPAVLEYMRVAILNEDQFLFAVTARLKAADSYAYLGQRDRAITMYRDIIQRYGAVSEYGRTAQAHLENVEAGRPPLAIPPVS
jgi:TolA-binding protein